MSAAQKLSHLIGLRSNTASPENDARKREVEFERISDDTTQLRRQLPQNIAAAQVLANGSPVKYFNGPYQIGLQGLSRAAATAGMNLQRDRHAEPCLTYPEPAVGNQTVQVPVKHYNGPEDDLDFMKSLPTEGRLVVSKQGVSGNRAHEMFAVTLPPYAVGKARISALIRSINTPYGEGDGGNIVVSTEVRKTPDEAPSYLISDPVLKGPLHWDYQTTDSAAINGPPPYGAAEAGITFAHYDPSTRNALRSVLTTVPPNTKTGDLLAALQETTPRP